MPDKRPNRSFFLTLVAFALLSPFASSHAADAFDQFAVHDDSSKLHITYTEFERFLESFSEERSGRKNLFYSAIQEPNIQFINAYVNGLAGISPAKLSRDQQLAYWINLHNALVIQAIAVEKPGRNLKKHRGNGFDPGEMWTQKRVSIDKVSLSIHDIEENVILRQFKDPNVIYGLYQGSKGGPPLHVVSGNSIHSDLKAIGERFVNARRAIKVKSGEAAIPLVYHWYKDALFNGDDEAVVNHLKTLAKPKLQRALNDAYALGAQSSSKFSYSLDEAQVRLAPQGVESGDYDSSSAASSNSGSGS